VDIRAGFSGSCIKRQWCCRRRQFATCSPPPDLLAGFGEAVEKEKEEREGDKDGGKGVERGRRRKEEKDSKEGE